MLIAQQMGAPRSIGTEGPPWVPMGSTARGRRGRIQQAVRDALANGGDIFAGRSVRSGNGIGRPKRGWRGRRLSEATKNSPVNAEPAAWVVCQGVFHRD